MLVLPTGPALELVIFKEVVNIGLATASQSEGSLVQIAHHIVLECLILRSPCSIMNINNKVKVGLFSAHQLLTSCC